MRQIDQYYELLDRAREARRAHNYTAELTCYRESIPLLGALVDGTRREYGSFDLSSIPAIEEGSKLMAIVGDIRGLDALRPAVSSRPELEPWMRYIDEAFEDIEVIERIVGVVNERPGVLQRELKKYIEGTDGRRLSNLCYWLDAFGRLRREKAGSSYALYGTSSTAPSLNTKRAPSVDSSSAGCGVTVLLVCFFMALIWRIVGEAMP